MIDSAADAGDAQPAVQSGTRDCAQGSHVGPFTGAEASPRARLLAFYWP